MTSPPVATIEEPPSVPDEAPWTTHAAELSILFLCARTTRQDQDARLRRLLRRDLDWGFLLTQAARHCLQPMVAHHLSRVADEVPSDVRTALEARRENVLGRNLHHLQGLLQVVETLEDEDIPVLSFKGPLLAKRYYDNLGLRRFVDLDLLVPRVDLRRADAILQADGFKAPSERPDGEVARRIKQQVGVDLRRPKDGLRVELHWALLNRSFAFPLDPEGLWARAQQCRIGSTDVRMLGEEDRLLYLCAHGAKHHWARLKWLCDVAEVCRRASTLDGEALIERAVQLDLDRLLFLGLRLAKRWLDAPIPPALHGRLRDDPTVSTLIRHVEAAWLFRVDGVDRTPRWDQLRFFLRTRRRWRNRWPLLREYGTLALTPTDNDRALVDLPSALSPLYYLIRPFRLLRDGLLEREDATSAG
jgi:hypothetical protein